MCGIVGYIGKKPCVNIIFEGLKKLEYRGYDSAGIAVLENSSIQVVKSQGKLAQLQPLLGNLSSKATVGMGHTRWATHGPPITKNAHPHISQDVAVVHNGIIENYRELKSQLLADGVEFLSDTDTEVVLHWIQKLIKSGLKPRDSILKTIAQLKGAFSLGVLFASEPDAIYLVKQGSPLVVGLSEEQSVFGSDATALIDLCKSAIFLNDGEFGKLKLNHFELWNFAGESIRFRPTMLNWSSANIEKRGFKHYMLKEIHEQPNVASNIFERLVRRENEKVFFNLKDLGLDSIDLSKVRSIQLVACGSAYYASFAAKYFLESRVKIPVSVELASEFRYRQPYLDSATLLIAVSQSGETADTLACVKHAKSLSCQVMSVCNVAFSSIPRESHGVLYMEAGPEIGVCSTKCFVAQILCLHILSLAMCKQLGKLTSAEISSELEENYKLPALMDRVLNLSNYVEQLVVDYYERPNFLFIGRGLNYAMAMEGALKLKEISYAHAEAYAAGELKHGPIALVDRHMPIVAIATKDNYYEKTISNVEEVVAREGVVIGLGDEDDNHFKSLCASYISIPSSKSEVCQAILNIIPLQLLSYYVATKRGTDVDQPRNLAKSVTVE